MTKHIFLVFWVCLVFVFSGGIHAEGDRYKKPYRQGQYEEDKNWGKKYGKKGQYIRPDRQGQYEEDLHGRPYNFPANEEPSSPQHQYFCGEPLGPSATPTFPSGSDYMADGTCGPPSCTLKISHFDSMSSPTVLAGQGELVYTMHDVELVGQSPIIPQLTLYHSYIDNIGQPMGIGDPSGDSVVDCLGALDDTTQREAHIIVEPMFYTGANVLRILHTPIFFLEY